MYLDHYCSTELASCTLVLVYLLFLVHHPYLNDDFDLNQYQSLFDLVLYVLILVFLVLFQLLFTVCFFSFFFWFLSDSVWFFPRVHFIIDFSSWFCFNLKFKGNFTLKSLAETVTLFLLKSAFNFNSLSFSVGTFVTIRLL